MLKILAREPFEVGGKLYNVYIRTDYEVILELVSTNLNKAGYEIEGDIRVDIANKHNAIRIYKRVIAAVEKWLYLYRPPYIKWSAGGDISRVSLYDRMGKRLDKAGYVLVKDPDDPNYYYAYKYVA